MIQSHIILFLLWVLFSVLHSLFAADSWKKRAQLIMKSNYKFYRVVYSCFSLITLMTVTVYNFYILSFPLWGITVIERLIAIACMLICGSVMLLFTKKFFFDLSGADVFKKQPVSRQLIKTDLYKYVRHPLYSATLGFIWSIFFFSPLLSNLISCICISIYTVAGIYLEEKKLVYEFGENYKSYRSQTPMLIPKIFLSNKPID